MIIFSNGLKECVEQVTAAAEWKKKHGKQRHLTRGIGLAFATDVIDSKMYKYHESAGAIVKV